MISFQEDKLLKIQHYLQTNGLAGFLLPLADPFGSDYVAPYYNYFPWLTGFTGSQALGLITPKRSVIFLDSRYTIQGRSEIDSRFFDIEPYNTPSIKKWVHLHIKSEQVVGYDPWLFSVSRANTMHQLWAELSLPLKAVLGHPLAPLRPPSIASPESHIIKLDEKYTGASFTEKATKVWEQLTHPSIQSLLISNPASICWLLNIRGQDIPHTPVLLSYALLHRDLHVDLFVHQANHVSSFQWEALVHVYTLNDFADHLSDYKTSSIAFDPAETPMATKMMLSHSIEVENPCTLLKACKNATEIEGMHQAHIIDGVALAKFFCWLEKTLPHTSITEYEAAQKIDYFRTLNPSCKGLSFDTIAAVGSHGAIVHFRATPQNTILLENGIFLLDSGGQYFEGTTDVTRKISLDKNPTPFQKDIYTRVLKGFLRLIRAPFPPGTTGKQLDALARYDLWQIYQDYGHSTGHGVGHYLSVHEGPAGIGPRSATPLLPGMILSNEPGCYLEGQFGVRIENLMVVVKKTSTEAAQEMLGFENLTLVPLDASLISFDDLDTAEKEWLRTYHKTILEKISPHLTVDEQEWLKTICKPFI